MATSNVVSEPGTRGGNRVPQADGPFHERGLLDAFLQLAKHARAIVWEVDETGLYTYVSDVVRVVLGYEPDELIGKKYFYDLHPEEGRDAFKREAFDVIARRATFVNLENPMVSADGEIIWASTNAMPMLNPDGTLRGYRGSDADISQRKQAESDLREAYNEMERRVGERTRELRQTNRSLREEIHERRKVEEALRESEDRYRRIVRATQSFVFKVLFKEGAGVQTLHEPGVEIVTGYSVRAYREDPELWHKMIYPDDIAMVLRHIADVQAGKPISVIEHRIYHQNGDVRWIRNTSVSIKNREDEVIGFDGLITDISDLKSTEAERDTLLHTLRDMASRDSMTGLLNRRGFVEELQRIWSLGRRHPFPIGLLILDIDHFKSINDTYGHVVGDRVIVEYAHLAQSLVRDSDTVSRYAGDELVVILPWTDVNEARLTAERMLKAVLGHTFCAGEYDLNVTASIGVFAQLPGVDRSVEDLLSRADRALYRAKQSGRNCVVLYGDVESGGDAGTEQLVAPSRFVPGGHTSGVVLVIDDDAGIRTLLKTMLTGDGYHVLTAADNREALEIALREGGVIDIALVDLNLGGESGLEVIRQLKEHDALLVPMVISGQASIDAAIESLRSGAYDFIQKPISFTQLSVLMGRALERRRLLLENQRYQHHLEAMVQQRGQQLMKSLEDQRKAHEFTLEAMATLVDAREKQTGAHCRRVAEVAAVLAQEMGAVPDEIEHIRHGALLHDIGKVAIPDSILLKPGALNEAEWAIMKTHPEIGHRILTNSPALEDAARIVYSHQERYDGAGYPRGLKGKEICLGARVFAVVDAYDAMRSDRVYRSALSPDDALNEIVQHKGSQFDPEVVDALIRCQAQLETAGHWEQEAALRV